MQRLMIAILLVLALAPRAAVAQASGQPVAKEPPQIEWEVKNRFRLFREDKDFQLHAEALRAHSILESEQVLAQQSEGRGWARNMLGRLCIDAAGDIAEPCARDGNDENYLSPADHLVGVKLTGADGNCAWTFDDGESAHAGYGACGEEVTLRVRYGRPTLAAADIAKADGTVEHFSAEILVRDLLIAGLGDSVAAGDGNPDRPVALADDGFCFRQFMSSTRSEYYRPGRAGFKGDKSCQAARPAADAGDAWNPFGAHWQNSVCHRSLYSYQLRAALALAVENPRIAVTFLPLACTGATIDKGLLNPQRARELDCGNTDCPTTVPAQVTQLRSLLETARRRDPSRQLDLVLLTVGANDVDFSGLVADSIIDGATARTLFTRSGVIGSVEKSDAALADVLPGAFVRLRTALKPLVGEMAHVLYVSYANPVLTADGTPCAGGRDGFDVHPAFTVNAERLSRASDFVQSRFLPRLKTLATCASGTICNQADALTFVDGHQAAFEGHGVCARSDADPDFDRQCFSPTGESFATSPVAAATTPLACERRPSEFRAYAPRARWVRSANDSYFAAMTYPQGVLASAQPADIHDATWGVLSAVYGGAIHPSAEGQAAMADAALAEARRTLALVPRGTVTVSPLATPTPAAAR